MEPKDKKWESGPRQDSEDERTDEQVKRAKEEVDRQNENLEDKGKGSDKEREDDK